MAAQALCLRQSGEHTARRFEGAVALSRAAALAEGPSSRLFASSPTGGAFMCIKLDKVYGRYLLATDTRLGVHLYDCELARG